MTQQQQAADQTGIEQGAHHACSLRVLLDVHMHLLFKYIDSQHDFHSE